MEYVMATMGNFDALTGINEIIEVDEATEAVWKAEAKEQLAKEAKAEEAKLEREASRQALLDKLGITAEEAALLIGSN